jgi:hypothetical protein
MRMSPKKSLSLGLYHSATQEAGRQLFIQYMIFFIYPTFMVFLERFLNPATYAFSEYILIIFFMYF